MIKKINSWATPNISIDTFRQHLNSDLKFIYDKSMMESRVANNVFYYLELDNIHQIESFGYALAYIINQLHDVFTIEEFDYSGCMLYSPRISRDPKLDASGAAVIGIKFNLSTSIDPSIFMNGVKKAKLIKKYGFVLPGEVIVWPLGSSRTTVYGYNERIVRQKTKEFVKSLVHKYESEKSTRIR